MTDVAITRVAGGPGLRSPDVGPGCGIHKNIAVNRTLFDFSAAAATENVFTAVTNCTIQRVTVVVNEAMAFAATINVGFIRGTTTTATAFVNAQTVSATAAAGSLNTLTLAASAVVAGDTVTVNHAGTSGGAGTGWVVVEYTIDDENN